MAEYNGLEDCLKDCIDKAKNTLSSHPEIKSVEIAWVNTNDGAIPRVYIETFTPQQRSWISCLLLQLLS